MSARLRGKVERVTLRRLKDGRLRHDTRIVFTDGGPFLSVRIQGYLRSVGWNERLLAALASRYEIEGDLPEPHWYGDTAA